MRTPIRFRSMPADVRRRSAPLDAVEFFNIAAVKEACPNEWAKPLFAPLHALVALAVGLRTHSEQRALFTRMSRPGAVTITYEHPTMAFRIDGESFAEVDAREAAVKTWPQ